MIEYQGKKYENGDLFFSLGWKANSKEIVRVIDSITSQTTLECKVRGDLSQIYGTLWVGYVAKLTKVYRGYAS